MASIVGKNVTISFSADGISWDKLQAKSAEFNTVDVSLSFGESWAFRLEPVEFTIELKARTINEKIALADLCNYDFDGTVN